MNDSNQRLFFALWPEQSVRATLLQRYQAQVGDLPGKPVLASNLHLTLHYLGNTAPALKSCFLRQARRVAFQPFQLTLNSLGFFQRARVGWIAPDSSPESLLGLRQRLADKISGCGFKVESRPWRPHVTMARKVRSDQAPVAIAPVQWWVDSFVLVHSVPTDQGVEYRVMHKFPSPQ